MAAEAAGAEAGLDPELTLTAAVKGIAGMKRFVPREVLELMRRRLEAVRRGAGDAFQHFVVDLCQHQSHPEYVPPSLV